MLSTLKYCRINLLLIAFTLLATSCTEEQTEEIQPQPQQEKTLRIMAIGNSITQGGEVHPSYRYELWKMLVDAELDFEFVGSMDTNWHSTAPDTENGADVASPVMGEAYKGKTFTNRHEGHWGWTLKETLHGKDNPTAYKRDKGKLSEWLKGYTPDAVLMHMGTNDMIHSTTIDSTLNRLERVVHLIRAKNGEVAIFMAKITPIPTNFVNLDSTRLYNRRVGELATRLSTQKSPVFLVDMNTGYTPDTFTYDGLHPNQTGEKFMAKRWFDALMANRQALYGQPE